MTFACPNCASEHTQKISIAHSSGTSIIGATTVGVSVGTGDVGVASTQGLSQTALAQSLAPPSKRSTAAPYGNALTGGCFLWLVGYFLIAAIFGLKDQGLETLAGILLPVAFGVAILVAIVQYREARQYNEETYPAEYKEWDAKFVCLRCAHVFQPKTYDEVHEAARHSARMEVSAPSALRASEEPIISVPIDAPDAPVSERSENASSDHHSTGTEQLRLSAAILSAPLSRPAPPSDSRGEERGVLVAGLLLLAAVALLFIFIGYSFIAPTPPLRAAQAKLQTLSQNTKGEKPTSATVITPHNRSLKAYPTTQMKVGAHTRMQSTATRSHIPEIF